MKILKNILSLFGHKDEPESDSTSIQRDVLKESTTRVVISSPESQEASNGLTMLRPVVIGIGGAGARILNHLILNECLEHKVPTSNILWIGFDWSYNDGTGTAIANVIMLNEPTACGTTLENEVRNCFDVNTYESLIEEYEGKLQPVFDANPPMVILVVGLGSRGGYQACAIAKEFIRKNIDVKVIASLPYRFEGESKINRAKDALLRLRNINAEIIELDLNTLEQEITDPIMQSIRNAYSLADHSFMNLILQVLSDERQVRNEIQEQTPSARLEENKFSEEYGQVQTICDIIKTLNDKHHYTSVEAITKDMAEVMGQYVRRGTIGKQTLMFVLKEGLQNELAFKNGKLDYAALKRHLLNANNSDSPIEQIMSNRDVNKFLGLLSYMNEFRRYTSVEQIKNDFRAIVRALRDDCKSRLNDRMFHGVPLGGHAYPYFSFFRALYALWEQVSVDGVLDNTKLQAKMIDEYQQDKQEYGLEKVAAEHYHSDSPCHPEVYFPNPDYHGPVLVADEDRMRFVESCGEGKGPNRSPDLYEFRLTQALIESDSKYIRVGEGGWESYLIPKCDNTLPVYGYMGKIHFSTQEEKDKFLKKKRRFG